MTTLETLAEQERDMREMSRALRFLLTPGKQEVETIRHITHTLLCDLCSRVSAHLAEEHQELFPELLSHGDIRVQNLVWGFIENDKSLRDEFQLYRQQWLRDCDYEIDSAFIDKTLEILDLLEQRLDLENAAMIPELRLAGVFERA